MLSAEIASALVTIGSQAFLNLVEFELAQMRLLGCA
jgi:hypothetical protein